ncbi:MAG: biotin--[acetyl-CoA-carboxylase] ligase [Spirochaetaceae bacterium]
MKSKDFMEQLDLSNPFRAPILYIPETRSTMEEAREYVSRCAAGQDETGVCDGTAIVTGFQSRGRGRISSRSWESPPGQSILTTLVFNRGKTGGNYASDRPPSLESGKPESGKQETYNVETLLPVFSIILALSVVRYLQGRYGLEAEIKWPNDVMVGGRKISGILCEVSAHFVYAGIGINCLQRSFATKHGGSEELEGSEELGESVTSVRRETGWAVDPAAVDPVEEVPHLLYYIKAVLEQSARGGDPVGEAEKILYRRGERVSLVEGLPEGGRVLEGRLEGLSESGALLLRTRNGDVHSLVSGEFSFRPRQ